MALGANNGEKTMHCNVKAPKGTVYEMPEQAIQHIWLYGLYPLRHWQEVSFGRDMDRIRRVNEAMKAKDYRAFVAHRRRGFWRVELA